MDDNIFSHDALRALMTTSLDTGGKRGKTSFTLLELLQYAKKSCAGHAINFISDVVPRHERRVDITLTSFWVESMKNVNVAFAEATRLADGVKVHMGGAICKRAKVVWHAQIVHPGASRQDIHVDDGSKRCYYTLIVPLTSDPRAGGTYFPGLDDNRGRTFSAFGGAVAFDGNIEHAGLANRSANDRIFLYAVILTGKDFN